MSRAYIFESSGDGTRCFNTFEWCGEGVTTQIDILQDICSMLQCAMLDEGKFVGYVGFDECRKNRAWNERQIAAFKLTANVLSTFLMKLREKQKKEKTT